MQKGRKGCVLSAPEENWAKAQKGSIRHFESADWHSKSVEWYFWTSNALSCSSAFWIPFLGFLEPGLALRRVSNPYSKIFTFFLDNLGLFSNNYLVDKYSKIIWIKFTLSTILLLSNYSFYSYASNPILKLIINQSQNYLINFNFLNNQN